jgi:hypothetical protein
VRPGLRPDQLLRQGDAAQVGVRPHASVEKVDETVGRDCSNERTKTRHLCAINREEKILGSTPTINYIRQ